MTSSPRVLPKTQQICPAGMDVGMEVWRDTSKGNLFVRFLWAQYRKQAALVLPISATPNRYGQWRMVIKKLS